jgi:hypothetical protein
MTMIIDGTNGLTFNNATTQASAGTLIQVVNATTTTQVTNATSTQADTGLTATITPRFASSRILVLISQNGIRKNTSDTRMNLFLYKNASLLSTFELNGGMTSSTARNGVGGNSLCYMDSPATTSATTYKTTFTSQANTADVSIQTDNCMSTITLMEIA